MPEGKTNVKSVTLSMFPSIYVGGSQHKPGVSMEIVPNPETGEINVAGALDEMERLLYATFAREMKIVEGIQGAQDLERFLKDKVKGGEHGNGEAEGSRRGSRVARKG